MYKINKHFHQRNRFTTYNYNYLFVIITYTIIENRAKRGMYIFYKDLFFFQYFFSIVNVNLKFHVTCF